MWWAGSARADLYLGEREVALHLRARPESDRSALPSIDHRPVEGLDDAMRQVRQWSAQLPVRTDLRVWLSAGLCRPFVMEAVANLRNDDELRRVAQALACQRVHCDAPVTIWVEQAQARDGNRLVVAAATPWIEATMAACARRGLQIRSMRPWWASVVNNLLASARPPAALGVIDTDALVVIAGHSDQVELAECLAGVPDDGAARAHVARVLVDFDVGESPTPLLRLDWTASGASGVAVDAFRPWVRQLK